MLLLEDNKAVRTITALSLRKVGFIVFETENAESAKNIFHRENGNFNLCLIDVRLPDMDGISLDNELTNQNRVNILFISGQAEPSLNKSIITKLNCF